MSAPLHITCIGGTVRPGSSSEQALRIAARHAEQRGATTRVFGGQELARLPMYAPETGAHRHDPVAQDLLADLRLSDGIIIASPGYHGSMSGLVKNALDYAEELRDDAPPYLTDRSIGLVVTAYGWQAAVTTLSTLRTVVHALRGWVTPFGAAVNSALCTFEAGTCSEARVDAQLATVADEVVRFADLVAGRRRADAAGEDAGPTLSLRTEPDIQADPATA